MHALTDRRSKPVPVNEPPRWKWALFQQMKRDLPAHLTPKEREAAVQAIAKRLGV